MRALLVYILSKLHVHVPYDGNNIELLNTANTGIEGTDTIYSEMIT